MVFDRIPVVKPLTVLGEMNTLARVLPFMKGKNLLPKGLSMQEDKKEVTEILSLLKLAKKSAWSVKC